ncbi:uncharacterized protein LOC114531336 isoform X2 [Dendronephthya gigantea]|nr:uncharacterized protein LOC114531336 isoform X2 [Dendronephthya gigantea]
MASGEISDRQLTAASEASGAPAIYGRLGGKVGWRGEGSISSFDDWYQVDFVKRAKVTAIKMEGEVSSSFIQTFKLSYSSNGIDFVEYWDIQKPAKIFTGQDHVDVMVEHRLVNVIFSRFLRIHPISGSVGMRMEAIGCYVDTILRQTIPLGMENGLILDSQLSASSERYHPFSGAASARSNLKTALDGRYGGWIAAEGDDDLWLEINFISNVTVTAILTQGLDVGMNYVKEYTVAFNNSELGAQEYSEMNNGAATVFNATNGTVKQDLDPYIFAHVIRIKPKTCVGMCALRVEFFGWYEEYSDPGNLGMYNRSLIPDSQIRSSVATAVDHGAHAARINNTHGWLGVASGDYLEIDFGRRASITQIMTQGAQKTGNSWTRNFTVAMSNDGVKFVEYQEFGSRKTFSANTDHTSIVVQKPMHVIFARFIRIVADFFVTKPGLALEFVGRFVDTPEETQVVALGMEDHLILDSQIFASSSNDLLTSGPTNARLNLTNNSIVVGGWIPAEADSAPWLLVDFVSNVTIKEIDIQLLENGSSYVRQYSLDYGITRGSLQNYVHKDSSQSFFVENNNRSTVRQRLDPAIFTRFIRLNAKACAGNCALRIEFYGYYEECINPQPLGVENGNISDSQLDSSSIPTITSGPERARLNMPAGGAELSDSDPDMWYEVDLVWWTKITGIKTQGAAGKFELVQTFTLSYSSDGNKFIDYKEYGQVKLFVGNSEVDTVVEQRFSRVILSRYLRINPDLWSGKVVLRMEVMGLYVATDWFDPIALGMENKMILDSQLAVSSQYSISVASNARLNLETLRENIDENTTKIVRYGGWVAAEYDNEPWFEVDFKVNVTISAIITQSLDNGTMSSRITKYAVAFRYNKMNSWQNYSIDGQVKVFSASYKNSSLVKNNVYPHITARILRIMPRAWVGYCAMRVEFYGRYEECTDPQPLGLENGYISDGQLSSSTEFDLLNGAHNARLNLVLVTSVRDGGASLASSDNDKWFQVDFLRWTKITGSKTQGHADDDYWVERFNLQYSNNEIDFNVYKENGIVKEFRANYDKNTIVEQHLARSLVTRFLRVVPTKSNGNPSIRMEFIGSYVNTVWSEPISLGMEDSLILDSQIVSSSSKYVTSTVANARLNLNALSDENTGDVVRHGGWIAADDDRHPWLQVDFIINVTLTAIATQGLENGTSWLTGYTLSFGDDRHRMQDFSIEGRTKVFSANSDSNTTITQIVDPNIIARFIRIKPQTWVANCTVRLEFYGRYEGCSNPQPLGMESGAILDSQLSSSGSSAKLNGPQNARLNLTYISGVRGGGSHLDNGADRWVQVDFLKWAKVTEIRTQGEENSAQYFIQSFTLLHGNDGSSFRAFEEFGKIKVFRANYENKLIVPQRLTRAIFTRFLRVVAKTWPSGYHPGIRMELFGEYVDTDWFEAAPLGMESRLIVESQLTASSSKDVISGPSMARLSENATAMRTNIITPQITAFNATMNITNNITTVNTSYIRHGGWMAAIDDTNPWFQVDFRTNVTVTALLLQGLDSGLGWVTRYTLAYGHKKDVLQDYNVGRQLKLFAANYNDSSTVRQDLYTYIIARFLRIIPKTWVGSCALRVEFYGRYEGCANVTRLGMENETILDSQIDASSLNDMGNPAAQARLNLQPASPLLGCWIALSSDLKPWLKVDFLAYAKITGIETQGRPDSASFVEKFTLSYGNNNDDFVEYKEMGIVKEFIANYDQNTVVKQRLTRVIYARFIRLHPTTWESQAAMRTEFFGCLVEPDWFESWPLGMESGLILEFQLSASSSKFALSGAHQGRLNLEYKFNVSTSEIEGYGGWIAANDDSDPWFQVNFITNVTVAGIATQGVNESGSWVTSYEISYGNRKNTLQDYQINGAVKVFSANIDTNSTVRHNLELPFVGVYVRVKPKTWENGCGMRCEFYGHFEGDKYSIALGMESGLILDGQISASSLYSTTYREGLGRLNNNPNSGAAWQGWRPLDDDANPWFQVDFEIFAKVTSIFTLGLDGSTYWTKKYLVSFSNDGRNFQNYIEFGKPKVFIANIHNERLVEQRLTHVIFARYIRIHPTEWNTYVGLRVDFNGSYLEYDCIDPIPLGLESNLVVNPQLTSSSEKGETSRARNARLRLEPIDGERDGAWIASADDSNPWLRVDFKSNVTLRGITTQGRFDAAEWVTSYEVTHSIDGINYETYKEDGNVKVFPANYDSNTTVMNYIHPPIFAQYVRLHPKQWSGACALRAEFHGCYEGCPNPKYLGLASKVISDSQFNSSSTYATGSLYFAYGARLNLTSAGWIALARRFKSMVGS